MKQLTFSKVFIVAATYIRYSFLKSTTVTASDICTDTCNRWGEVIDCGTNCPPCRTRASPGSQTNYHCWDYLYGTEDCPKWVDIVDCGKASPGVQAAVSAAPAGSEATPGSLTIWNQCGSDYTVKINGANVPSRCLNGNYCRDYYGSNPAFYVRKPVDDPQLGITLAELYVPIDRNAWYDISKVAGFNVGVEIKYSMGTQDIVCADVNCPDAYYLCDIAVTNVFNPVYTGAPGGHFDITFCPESPSSKPLNPPSRGVERMQVPTAGPFTCDVKINGHPTLPGTIVYGGAIY